MNIDERILSKLTDEQKKMVEPQGPLKSSFPWQRKPGTN